MQVSCGVKKKTNQKVAVFMGRGKCNGEGVVLLAVVVFVVVVVGGASLVGPERPET